MGMDLHSSRNIMVAIYRSNMKTSEYVYVVPWLAHVNFLFLILFLFIAFIDA